jgi:hypothetical protein
MVTTILDHRPDMEIVGVRVYSSAKDGADIGTEHGWTLTIEGDPRCAPTSSPSPASPARLDGGTRPLSQRGHRHARAQRGARGLRRATWVRHNGLAAPDPQPHRIQQHTTGWPIISGSRRGRTSPTAATFVSDLRQRARVADRVVPELAIVHGFARRLLVFHLPDQLTPGFAKGAGDVAVFGDGHQRWVTRQGRA